MSEPISPVQTNGLKQQETVSFRTIVPSGISGIVHAIRDRTLSREPERAARSLIPPVSREYKDPGSSSERASEASSIIFSSGEDQKTSIQQLIDLGFKDLAEKLSKKSGSPWNDILRFKNPLLIEQLYDLAVLLENLNDPAFSRCMETGLKIAKGTEDTPSQLLGKFIYLMDVAPEISIRRLKEQESLNWIDDQFEESLKVTKELLLKFKKRHINAAIQDPKVAYRNQLPIELSKYLISSTGHLNIGLIQPLLQSFISENTTPLNYEKHLIHSLNYLATTPALREKLSRIQRPQSPTAPANIVIRTTLDLNPEYTITDLDSKRCAFTSLVTLLRQGKDGSCFATPLAISLLNHYLEMCVKDFCQLLEESKLTRNVEGVLVDFPFLLRIGDQNLLKKVRINRNGQLIRSDGKLVAISKVPGVIAVKKAMGIDEIKITESLFSNIEKEESYVEINLKELLKALVKQAKTVPVNKDKRLAELYLHASFAYEAQECNPLLETWENSIACMAEADGQSMVRSVILNSSIDVLTHFLKQPLESFPVILEQASSLFNKTLNNKIHLQWDPHIPNISVAADQHSTEGAFVLYDKGAYDKPSRWVRLDTPQSYQAFILRTIDEVKNEIGTLLPINEKKAISPILKKLEDYVESESFLLDSLRDYYPPNGKHPNLLQNVDQLIYTPWITKSGNSLLKVMQIYLEKPELSPVTHIEPKNGRELLEKLILLMKTSERNFQNLVKTTPYICTPVRIPFIHAFSFLPGHPSFIPAWSEELDVSEWMEEQVLKTGVEISESILSTELKNQLIKEIKGSLIQRSNRIAYHAQVEKLPASLSIKELRKSLVEIIVKLESDNSFPPHTIANQVDLRIYQILPDSFKDRLHHSAVHIADTNWADGINSVHFCLVVNPGTGDLELWSIKDDSSMLIPLDQIDWFDNKGWEFFKIKP